MVSTVKRQPENQLCSVRAASGTVGLGPVTVNVDCVTQGYTVGGVVTGLVGTGLVLRNNGAEDLAIAANGAFFFPTPVPVGGAYAVTVKGLPPNQKCSVSAGTGMVTTGNIGNVEVACREAVRNVVIASGNASGQFSDCIPGALQPYFTNVTIMANPSAQDLAAVNADAVLAFQNGEYPNPIALGNTLADFLMPMVTLLRPSLVPEGLAASQEGGRLTVIISSPAPTLLTRSPWAP
jgi:hypothetical protein